MQEIIIQIETKIKQEVQIEVHQITEPAVLYEKKGLYYIKYQTTEGKVTMKINPQGELTIIRYTPELTALAFNCQQELYNRYPTPQGIFQIKSKVKTFFYKVDEITGSGKMQIAYQLLIDDVLLGDYEMSLDYHKKD